MIAFITEAAGRRLPRMVNRVGRTTDEARAIGSEFVTMPTDLRLWACEPTILAWIEQEIYGDSRGPSSPGRCGNDTGLLRVHATQAPARAPALPVSSLLRVLTFAYATQRFASEEIASHCRGNALFQRLCCGSAPFEHEVRSFRRGHRVLLERVLSGVFMRAILHRFGLMAASVPAELEADLREHARERLNIARHLDAGEE